MVKISFFSFFHPLMEIIYSVPNYNVDWFSLYLSFIRFKLLSISSCWVLIMCEFCPLLIPYINIFQILIQSAFIGYILIGSQSIHLMFNEFDLLLFTLMFVIKIKIKYLSLAFFYFSVIGVIKLFFFLIKALWIFVVLFLIIQSICLWFL